MSFFSFMCTWLDGSLSADSADAGAGGLSAATDINNTTIDNFN